MLKRVGDLLGLANNLVRAMIVIPTAYVLASRVAATTDPDQALAITQSAVRVLLLVAGGSCFAMMLWTALRSAGTARGYVLVLMALLTVVGWFGGVTLRAQVTPDLLRD